VVDSESRMRDELMCFPEPMPHNFSLIASQAWPSKQEFDELLGWLENLITAKCVYHNTVEAIGPILMEQGLRNIALIATHPSFASLKGKFKGKPAIIVSPGPSLSQNIQLLKEFKGKGVIITGTHSLSAFKSSGIDPDIVMAVDVGDLSTHYDDYDMTGIEALILGNSTRRHHYAQKAKRILTLPANKNSDEWFYQSVDKSVDVHTGGSVSCTALSLAEIMGCSPILLVGQDLAFKGTKYYADECIHGQVELVETSEGAYLKADEVLIDGMLPNSQGDLIFAEQLQLTEVDGYYGGKVKTSKILRGFLWWFESYIKLRTHLPPVWNCTEGGAHIEGAVHKPLATALEELEHCVTDVPKILTESLASHDVGQRRDALVAQFSQVQSKLLLCSQLAERCQQAVPAAAKDRWSLNKLQTLENLLTEATQSLDCLAWIAQRDIISTLEEARRAPDLARNLSASMRLYDIVQRGSKFLLEPLEAGLQELAELEAVV
jgi:hypothetical protein